MSDLTTEQRDRLARTVQAADAESYVTRIADALSPVVAELLDEARADGAFRAVVELRPGLAVAWNQGRAAGHRETRPVNAFGDTESASNPYLDHPPDNQTEASP